MAPRRNGAPHNSKSASRRVFHHPLAKIPGPNTVTVTAGALLRIITMGIDGRCGSPGGPMIGCSQISQAPPLQPEVRVANRSVYHESEGFSSGSNLVQIRRSFDAGAFDKGTKANSSYSLEIAPFVLFKPILSWMSGKSREHPPPTRRTTVRNSSNRGETIAGSSKSNAVHPPVVESSPPGDVVDNEGWAPCDQLGPHWSKELLESILRKRGELILSTFPTQEALDFQRLAGDVAHAEIEEVDTTHSLVLYSRDKDTFDAIYAGIDAALRARRRRQTPAPRGGGRVAMSNRAHRRRPFNSGEGLTTFGVILVIGVAALGGIFAGVVIYYGPFNCVSVAVWLVIWPFMLLKALVQCGFKLTAYAVQATFDAALRAAQMFQTSLVSAIVCSWSFAVRQVREQAHYLLSVLVSWLEELLERNAQLGTALEG
ncbi:hypothetical protein FA13DRAFT_1720309 [Coprinellus micaceus]|uniref:Transmembrane protein n=1 Tax=Coprinellus micaceus TaxID=71717 RepID=A0A4Y7SBM8_COPMI|nr:hypothetical protein FA13DRAFT_1720309 [Coprinellus micaceus]